MSLYVNEYRVPELGDGLLLVVQADLGDQRQLQMAGLQYPGHGLENRILGGHPTGFQGGPLRDGDPGKGGGALNRQAQFTAAALDTGGQEVGKEPGRSLGLQGRRDQLAYIVVGYHTHILHTPILPPGQEESGVMMSMYSIRMGQSSTSGNYQNMTSAPQLPDYLGIPFRILVSPFVHFDPGPAPRTS